MEDKLEEILKEVLDERGIEFTLQTIEPSHHLRNDLHLDSLGLAILTVKIEDEFDVDIFEDGIISTVEEILEKIK